MFNEFDTDEAAEKSQKRSMKIIFPEINFVVYKRSGKDDYHSIKYVSKKSLFGPCESLCCYNFN